MFFTFLHKEMNFSVVCFSTAGLGLDLYSRTHDPMNYISPERAQAGMANMPVPMGMFMNMSHVPPRFYNLQQAAQGKASC